MQTESKVEFIFNQEPSLIKSFNSIMYEGSQGKVQRGAGYTDNNFYGYKSLFNKDGWYVHDISTEKENGNVLNFLEKEDKWFGSIRGKSSGVNDIDLKNFNVQGVGSISSINVTIPNYLITPGVLTLTNTSNTVSTSEIEYSFSEAVSTGSYPIVSYTVQIRTGSQSPQIIMITDSNGNLTQNHEPQTNYNYTVSSNYNSSDPNNLHRFIVTATDSLGESIVFVEDIVTTALQTISMTSPVLNINQNTFSNVTINVDLPTPTPSGSYSYSLTYSYGGVTYNATNITGQSINSPGSYLVQITPTPSQPEDIEFSWTVINVATGETLTTSSTINAGVNTPLLSLPSINFSFGPPLTLLQGQQNSNIISNITNSGFNYALFSFQIDVAQATNGIGNVSYELTELYYFDAAGDQISISYIPNGGLLNPPYGLTGSGFNYIFATGSTGTTSYSTPTPITTSVLLGSPIIIDGVLFLNPPTMITGSNWPVTVYCTVTATDIAGFTDTQTATIQLTV